MYQEKIRIGTLVAGGPGTVDYIREILPYGFESFAITFWQSLGGTDLKKLAAEVNDVLAGSGVVISCVSAFGNPLMDNEGAAQTREAWSQLIDACELFGCDIVTGFTGRVVDQSIDANIPRYVEVFEPLAKQAADKGVRLAFENCDMGGNWKTGDWNIAHTPDAWDLMFNVLPMDNIGLEWEPCHQMVKLIDPIPQLSKYVKKVFHLHGKDATVMWPVVREHGINGPRTFAYHRTPGFGDSNWTDIISILRQGGFTGAIDIEGWHDPVYREELEMMGQVRSCNYLKDCRGGAFYPNPVVQKV